MSRERSFRLHENAPLRDRNTFGVEAIAPLLAQVAHADALPALFRLEAFRHEPVLVLGGGSNLLFAGDPDGAVLGIAADAMQVIDKQDGRAILRADAGADWHALVLHSLQLGLGGLENLALIPGTVGAAPIQNIGAYGVEVAEHIHAVEAFERDSGRSLRLSAADCGFAYRDSLFKREPERFIVTAVEFVLARAPMPRLDYAGLREELGEATVSPTPRQVAEAVIRIRRRKLPDPAVIGNAGSFFKNPIVQLAQAEALLETHPQLPLFRSASPGTRKLSAAWMIDACGWRGHRDGDAGVAAQHALVLVNHGTASGAQLLALARRIAASVRKRFGVTLEPEPRIIGAHW